VNSLRVLERANSAGEPDRRALVGDDLVFVATGQWDRFGDGRRAEVPDKPPVPSKSEILPLTSS
jgi:hypothetical protein